MTRVSLALMWLLHWLPLPMLAVLGRLFGRLLHAFGRDAGSLVLRQDGVEDGVRNLGGDLVRMTFGNGF